MIEVLHLIDLDWRDGLSILATLITIVGFGVTIYQLLQTKSAARAASESASQALNESRARFEDYSFANLIQYTAEIEQYASRGEWELVTLRLNDLVRQAMQLSHSDPDWDKIANQMLEWPYTCRRMADGDLKNTLKQRKNWANFLVDLKRAIEKRHGPFGQPIGEMSS